MPSTEAQLQIRVGGQWVTALGYWGEPVITHRHPLGCWEASWRMDLTPGTTLPALSRGAQVEVFHGPTRVWVGELNEPDWDEMTFHASGLARQAEHAYCFTAAGVTTSTPNTAVDQAIIRGALNWTRPDSLSAVAFADGGSTDSLNTVASLLDAWSESESKKWAVGADGAVRAAVDPTIPTWHIRPDVGTLGVADDDYVTNLFGRYRSAPGVFATAEVSDTTQGVGRRERAVDLTPLGIINSTKASAVLTGILAKTKARTGWTNGLTLTADDITTPGGTRAHLSLVRAGQMFQLDGLRDVRGLAQHTDIIGGETVWTIAEGTIQLNPVGLAARDFSRIVEEAGGVAS